MSWRSQNSIPLPEKRLTFSLEQHPPSSFSTRLRNYLGHLKVGQKIILGYAFVLGAAMLGTALGFIIADRYQNEAIHEEEDAIEELYQASRLKSAVFRVRTQQHKLILYMEQPEIWQEKYPQLLEAVADVRQEWIEFQTTFRNPSRRFKDTPREKVAYTQVMQTKSDFDNYLSQSEILFKHNNPKKLSPAAIRSTQAQLFNFMHNPKVFTLDEFLDNIEHLVTVTAAEYNQAKADLRRAEQLRLRIIAISLLLSAAIATLMVIYMNRAIARPIQTVTHVAQQVTEEANFDLQAPVSTQDEIGILAASLNRLIQEVQQLLKRQKDTNEQLEIYSHILEKKVQERTQELKEKNRSLQQMLAVLHRIQPQLMPTETVSSLGQLVARVVDEMNSPASVLSHKLNTATEAVQSLLELISTYQLHYPDPDQSVQTKIAAINLVSLQQELPNQLISMQAEVEQIIEILQSLQQPPHGAETESTNS